VTHPPPELSPLETYSNTFCFAVKSYCLAEATAPSGTASMPSRTGPAGSLFYYCIFLEQRILNLHFPHFLGIGKLCFGYYFIRCKGGLIFLRNLREIVCRDQY
jgi:hypothetical protein